MPFKVPSSHTLRSATEVADKVGVNRKTILTWLDHGLIKATYASTTSQPLFTPEDVEGVQKTAKEREKKWVEIRMPGS